MSYVLQIAVVHPNGKVTGVVLMNWKKIIRSIINVKFYLKLKVKMLINLVPLHQPMPTPTPTAVTINQKSVPYVCYHLENSKLAIHLNAIIAFVWSV